MQRDKLAVAEEIRVLDEVIKRLTDVSAIAVYRRLRARTEALFFGVEAQ